MILDPAKKTSNANKIYHAILKKYRNIKPNIYLIFFTVDFDEPEKVEGE